MAKLYLSWMYVTDAPIVRKQRVAPMRGPCTIRKDLPEVVQMLFRSGALFIKPAVGCDDLLYHSIETSVTISDACARIQR